jgi:hypothetical protein
MLSEKERIDFLVRRDGVKDAQAWVGRTLVLYREAIASGASHAATNEYRPLFEQSIQEFQDWLQAHETSAGASAT